MMMAIAAPRQIDIWWVPLDDFPERDRSLALAVLNDEERARHDAYKVAPARTQFLAARALLRTTLSRYHDVQPENWRFAANSYGRPVVDGSPGNGTLHFSLSHTDGLVACAVAAFPDLGIDVECSERDIPYVEMVPSVLARAETMRLGEVPEASRAKHFITLWTLKEAYVKARGMGLSLPLNEVSFDLRGDVPNVRFGDAVADEPARWSFEIRQPTPRHVLSVAAAPPGGECTTVVRRTTAINLDGVG